METNEIMNTETVEITEDVREIGALGTGLIVGGAMVLGALAWNKALKPMGRFAKRKFAEFKEKKQAQPKEIEVTGNVE